MHRLAMASGGLAKFFFTVTLTRCCCSSVFLGPPALPNKFAQEAWPVVAVAAAHASGRIGTAAAHYPAELRQRRPAVPQLFFSTHKNLTLASPIANNSLSPTTTTSTFAADHHYSCSGAAPARAAVQKSPVPVPTDPSRPHRLHQSRSLLNRPDRPARSAERTMSRMPHAPRGTATIHAASIQYFLAYSHLRAQGSRYPVLMRASSRCHSARPAHRENRKNPRKL